MCEEEEKCEFKDALKACSLKHVGEAPKLVSKGRFEDADAELSYAEKHLKEM